MIKSPDTEVYIMGWRLPAGAQLSGQVCPYCATNFHAESSLSITRTADAILYQCHRASCNAKGVISAQPAKKGVADRVDVAGNNKYSTWLRVLEPTKQTANDWLFNNWGFTDEHRRVADIRWAPLAKRLAVPIYNARVDRVGYSLRSCDPSVQPKAMILMTKPDSLAMSFYHGRMNKDVMLVVEDQASAVRGSMYCNTLALLGTHFDGMRSARVRELNTKHIVFCLDKDAFANSVSYQQRFGTNFVTSRAVCPPKDLKNMNEVELETFLNEECGIKTGVVA